MYALIFILLFFNSYEFPPIRAEPVRKLNETQKEVLREFVRQVLNLDVPEYGPRDAPEAIQLGNKSNVSKPGNDKNNKFPKHMLELFEKHSFQNMVGKETIRSIEPVKDFVPHFKDILVFNMSGISRSEKIRSAQLHIHRRRLGGARGEALRGARLPPPCRVRLYALHTWGPAPPGDKELSEMERTKLRSLDSVLITQITRGGWHTIDISMALKEMLNSPFSGPTAIFGVRFEGPKGKAITAKHFLKETGESMSSSFIVVYTEDNSVQGGIPLTSTDAKLNNQQLRVIAELLEKSHKNPKSPENIVENSGKRRQGSNFYIYDKNRQMKKNLRKNKFYNADPIRHEKKYYRENYASEKKTKDLFSNDIDNNDIESVQPNQVLSPGNGDIIELLDYDRVRKANNLRRHNHKTINSLSLRYDTATKKMVQRKLGKPRLSHSKNEDFYKNEYNVLLKESPILTYTEEPQGKSFITKNPIDNIRSKRSVNDDSEIDQDYDDIKDVKTTEGEYETTEKENIKTTEKEFDNEDDMGDLSFDFNSNKNLNHFSEQKEKDVDKNNIKEGYLVYETDPDINLSQVENKDFVDNSIEDTWVGRSIAETNKLKYRQAKKTFPIEKDENVPDEKWSDNISTPWGTERRRHKNQKKSRKRANRVESEVGNFFSSGNTKEEIQDEDATTSECQLTKFNINFADIGWNDIIHPESIDMTFCLGACPVSSLWPNNSTDHAILQSIAHAIYRQHVPQACCAPDKMAPVNVILMYPSGDIALKSFRDMAVKSCRCR